MWRVGRRVKRTVYVQQSSDPTDHDMLIGLMDTSTQAALVVDSVNSMEELRRHLEDYYPVRFQERTTTVALIKELLDGSQKKHRWFS